MASQNNGEVIVISDSSDISSPEDDYESDVVDPGASDDSSDDDLILVTEVFNTAPQVEVEDFESIHMSDKPLPEPKELPDNSQQLKKLKKDEKHDSDKPSNVDKEEK